MTVTKKASATALVPRVRGIEHNPRRDFPRGANERKRRLANARNVGWAEHTMEHARLHEAAGRIGDAVAIARACGKRERKNIARLAQASR